MAKGKGQSIGTTQSGPPPGVMNDYYGLINRAQGVAATPFQAYGGQRIAPFSGSQEAAFSAVDQAQGAAQPDINQAQEYARMGAAPVSGSDIAAYENPYQNQVIGATLGEIQYMDANQQAQLTGANLSGGGLFNDRLGVAQANLAHNQDLANNETISRLNTQNYQQALAAAEAQKAAYAGASYQFGNLGAENLATILQGAQAQLGTGGIQQQQAQAGLNVPYETWQQQQAFPYQQTAWLAGLESGVGSQMGGQSTTTSQPPAPNPWSTALGLGLAGAGAYFGGPMGASAGYNIGSNAGQYLARGGAIEEYDDGGPVAGLVPYSDVHGYIPGGMSITRGSGPPRPPTLPQAKPGVSGKDLGQIFGAGRRDAGPGAPLELTPQIRSDVGDMAPIGEAPAVSGGLGALYRRGGPVERRPSGIYLPRGFDTGGTALMGPIEPIDDLPSGGGFAPMGRIPVGEGPGYGLSLGALSDSPLVERSSTGSSGDFRAGTPAARGIFRDARNPTPAEADEWAAAHPVTFAPGVADAMHAVRPDGTMSAADWDKYEATSPLGPASHGVAGNYGDVSGSPRGRNFSNALAYAGDDGGLRTSPAAPPGSGGGFSPRFGNALMNAGFTMMASRSPYLGEAIGQAGLAGLGSYQEQGRYEQQQGQQERRYNLEQGKVDAQVKKLDAMAEQSRQHLDLQTKQMADAQRKQDEVERHNREQERLADTKATTPPGFRRKDDGTLEPIPGGPQDPAAVKAKAEAQATGKTSGQGEDLDPVTLRRTAAQYNIMGPQALTNIGRGAQGAKALLAVRAEAARMDEEAGITPDQRAQLQAQYQGQKAAQRTLGTQEAKMGTAGFEARGAIELGRHAIENVPRTSFLPLNRLIQGFQNQTLSPEQAELYTRTQGIINAYAAVMARGANVTTDASRHRAEELLNTASDPAVYNRVLDTMNSEIDMAINAPDKMREFYMKKYGAAAAPAAEAPAGGGATAPATKSPPPGAPAGTRLAPDGKWYAPDPARAGKYLEVRP